MSQLNGWANVHGCNEWNSFYEEKISKDVTGSGDRKNKVVTPRALNDVIGKDAVRTHTGIGELDRVLGGGLVKGSLVLVGGEPGIGKSTLILQLCDKVQGDGKVLYVSGEESAEQIKLRADRLGIHNDDILFLGETDIELIENSILEIRPKLVIIDSIQTMYSDEISSAAGTVSQVREITARIMRVCKSNEITTIIILLLNLRQKIFTAENFFKKGVDKSKSMVYNAKHKGKDAEREQLPYQLSLPFYFF